MQNVAFLHDFLIEHNEGLNLRVCHFAGSACLGPSRPPILAFLHEFLIEHNEGLNLRVCHFAGSVCLGPSRPPIFASKPLPQEGGGREGAFPPPKVAPVRDMS